MKKSSQVRLTLLATMALAGCSRPYDPCRRETFNAEACQQSLQNGGYYYHDTWYPMSYGHSYPYYYNRYAYYYSNGGSISSAPAGSYSAPAGGVTRGGFGSIGAHGGSGE